MGLTPLSSPSIINMKKNNSDQKCDPGNVAIASGYTSNTNPGPRIIHTI